MRPEKEPNGVRRKRGRPSRGVRDAVLGATGELIRERGLLGVTTSVVAERAKASEASIHYHFGSKEALLEAAIVAALESLRPGDLQAEGSGHEPLSERLLRVATLLERVYDDLVPLLVAVHADEQLRQTIGPRLAAHDLGPHRAVARVARCIAAGPPGADDMAIADAEAAAVMVVGACFLRAWQRQMRTHRRRGLPSLQRAIAVLAVNR